MENFLIIAFALSFFVPALLIVFSYAVYPALLPLMARGKALPDNCFASDEEFPEVAVLMAVYNEESVLEKTLRSILESDYPQEKLSVWIGSDGSTDRSHEIVESFQRSHPELLLNVFPERNGKIRIINHLAKGAKKLFRNPNTAAFVLCDANVVWSEGALRKMVRHFKRENVGLVGSSVMDQQSDHDGIGHEEEAYVGRENRTKYYEGLLWGNMMGAFGACYAMRARLFTPVPEDFTNDDFFQTMTCIEQGSDAIADLEAEVYESVSVEIHEEFRRKTRIATGNFQNLKQFWNYLLPWNGGLANCFAFWSHKGVRWLGPHLLMLMIVSSVALSFLMPLGWVPFAGLLFTFLCGGIDHLTSRNPDGSHLKVFRFIRYFYVMNGAVLLGFLMFLRGGKNSVWEPTKRVVVESSQESEVVIGES